MTRVTEDLDTQRYEEQQRTQEKDKTKRQRSREDFNRLVTKKQAEDHSSSRQQQQAAVNRATQGTRGQEALLARHGIQSQSFQQHIEKRGHELVTDNRTQHKERTTDMKETRRGEAHQEVREKRELDQKEGRVSAVSRDDRGQGGGAGGGDSAESGAGGQKHGSMGGQHLAGSSAPAATTATEHAHGSSAPRLPPDVIRKLVERVYVGVNTEGLSEFHIEFKESVLAGSRLTISARDGKIFARFQTEDTNVGRLLKASEGELARAFGRKGLRLERLEVTGP
ncbi:MAG: hypothetical protein AAB426_12600 [Myxococcota bacterium]